MYVRSITIFILMTLLFSCKEKSVDLNFYKETNRRWLAATGISWSSPYYKQDTKILKPKGTWQAILEVSFIDKDFNQARDCVLYRVPSNEKEGELKIIPNRDARPCKELVGDDEYISLQGIINFGFEFNHSTESKENLTLKIDTHRLKYNFLNLDLKKYDESILSSSAKVTKFKGALITSDISYSLEKEYHKDGKVCFDVNDECKIIIEDSCDLCETSSFKTVSSACPTKYRRVCGRDICGTKGQAACLRGYLASGLDPSSYCINDSPVGICQKGLRVICENGTLICE